MEMVNYIEELLNGVVEWWILEGEQQRRIDNIAP